ncbi:MAG: hypothetical protein IPI67_05615 [Myxococcales bacterium]|nr:hypothetical protein [Myxococcales bacterium]
MPGYRDDRGALRERNEALEDDLDRAERKLREQEQALREQQTELERLREPKRAPSPPKPQAARGPRQPSAPREPAADPAAVVVLGTLLGKSRIRYHTAGGSLQSVAGLALIVLGAVISALSRERTVIPLLMLVPPALVLLHRRGIDVLPEEQIVVAWHSLGLRFAHRRLTSDRITIQNRKVRGRDDSGDGTPVANLYLGGALIGKNLPRGQARAIAEEVAQLCGDPPPESVG